MNELIDIVNQLEGGSTELNTSDIRLVNADSVKTAIEEVCDKYKIAYGDEYGGFGEAIAKVVDLQPTIENSKLKTSIWNTFRVSGSIFPIQYVCINCHLSSIYAYNYCPHCGDKMSKGNG